MNYSALVNEIVEKSKPKPPVCSVCGGTMLVSSRGNGTEEWVCAKVKAINQPGDTRPFDPGHYSRSAITKPMGVDLELLRRNLAEAFGKVEADAEMRVREEVKKAQQEVERSKQVDEKPKDQKKKELLLDAKKVSIEKGVAE